MTDDIAVSKSNPKSQVSLSIVRSEDGSNFQINIKAPILADVIEKMVTGVYPKSEYNEIYHEILDLASGYKDKIASRPALYNATANLRKGVDFNFNDKPCGCLLFSPRALREGYTLTYKPTAPIPVDDMKKWGGQFMSACEEILKNTRPFKMEWAMIERPGEAKSESK